MSAASESDARFAADDAPIDLPGVDGLWRFAASADDRARALGSSARQFVPPDGCADLILHFEGARLTNAFMLQPAERFEVVSIDARDALFGVRFQLGVGGACLRERAFIEGEAMHRFGAADAADAVGLGRDLGRFGASLADRLGGGCPPWLPHALSCLLERRGNLAVQMLARAVGVSERTLHRGFVDWVGATPKLLARTLRARAGVELALGLEPLAEVAATLGFADQAHFSRELRELWGATPGCIRRRAGGKARSLSDFFKTAPDGVA